MESFFNGHRLLDTVWHLPMPIRFVWYQRRRRRDIFTPKIYCAQHSNYLYTIRDVSSEFYFSVVLRYFLSHWPIIAATLARRIAVVFFAHSLIHANRTGFKYFWGQFNFKLYCVALTHTHKHTVARVKIQLKLRSTYSQFYCNVLAISILVFVVLLFFFAIVIVTMGVNFLLRSTPFNVVGPFGFHQQHFSFLFVFFFLNYMLTYSSRDLFFFQCFVFVSLFERVLKCFEVFWDAFKWHRCVMAFLAQWHFTLIMLNAFFCTILMSDDRTQLLHRLIIIHICSQFDYKVYSFVVAIKIVCDINKLGKCMP